MTKEEITYMAENIPIALSCFSKMVTSSIRGLRTDGKYTFPFLSWHRMDEVMDDGYLEEYNRTNGKCLEDEINEVLDFINKELRRVGYPMDGQEGEHNLS